MVTEKLVQNVLQKTSTKLKEYRQCPIAPIIPASILLQKSQYCGVLSTAIIMHCALYKLKGVATVLIVYIRTAPARMFTA